MIGKVYKSIVPYYDRANRRQSFKSRPCLIIGQADAGDYVVLPISSISDKSKVDPTYDISLDCSAFTFLHKNSYLRTHKQTVVNISLLKDQLVDFKSVYEETFLECIIKVEAFQKKMTSDAL